MSEDEFDNLGVVTFRIAVAPDGSIGFDKWGRATQALTGLSLADVRGKTAKDVMGTRFGDVPYRWHVWVAEHGQQKVFRQTLPTETGVSIIHTTLTPKVSDGRVTHIYGVSVDISDSVEAQRADAARLLALEESERFITMAAHDLRTPMRNVGIIADALLEEFNDLGDGKIDMVRQLETVSKKATGLIADVLAHAKASGAAVAPHETFNLAALAGDIFGVLDPKGLADLHAQDIWLETERPTMQIIIRNLVDNAIKHGARSDLSLRITVAEERGWLQVNVSDNGVGFSDPSVAFLGGGELRYETGFGLVGLRRLVESRGGDISADRLVDGGTVIRLRFPGRIVEAPDSDATMPKLTKDVII